VLVRLVLDTNVVLSGLLWRSHPRRLLDRARRKEIALYTSATLLDELADVLAREQFAPMLASQQTTPALLMRGYAMLVTRVTPLDIERVVARDPDDDEVLACAHAAHVDMIVSGDKHLLDLKNYQRIPIVKPAEAIKIVGG